MLLFQASHDRPVKGDFGERCSEGCHVKEGRTRKHAARRQAGWRGRAHKGRQRKGCCDGLWADGETEAPHGECGRVSARCGDSEQRYVRLQSQRAAFSSQGCGSAARTCPTKSTVVQPHLSALSCAPITYGRHVCPRARVRSSLQHRSVYSPRTTSKRTVQLGTIM